MFWNKKTATKRVFLDYASVTPIDSAVQETISTYSKDMYANPSALYKEALVAKQALALARERVARVLRAQKKDIIFTSGGTESNNLALLGVFEKYKTKTFTPHIVTIVTEHPAILEVCHEIERRGGAVTYLPVDTDGLVSVDDIKNALRLETVVVTVSYVNNEIGVVQPMHGIVKMIRQWRNAQKTEFPFVHTDACQAPLYLSLDVLKLGVDMMSLDGIKMYGPRGTGILYIRDGVLVSPVLFGGGQERGLRSGTEYVAHAVGFAEALELAEQKREKESARLTALRDKTIEKILALFPTAHVNGSLTERLPNNINICFPKLDAEFAVVSLDVLGVAVSYSSSCRTLKENSSSYVVESLGMEDCGLSSIRATLGRETTDADMDYFVACLSKVVSSQR